MEVVLFIGTIVEVFGGENMVSVLSVVFCFTSLLEIISVIGFGGNRCKGDGETGMIIGKLSRCKT